MKQVLLVIFQIGKRKRQNYCKNFTRSRQKLQLFDSFLASKTLLYFQKRGVNFHEFSESGILSGSGRGRKLHAAERLHVSQQALSGLLARLEKVGSPSFSGVRSGADLRWDLPAAYAIQILDIQRDCRHAGRPGGACFASVFRIRADSPSYPCCFRRSANSIPWSS